MYIVRMRVHCSSIRVLAVAETINLKKYIFNIGTTNVYSECKRKCYNIILNLTTCKQYKHYIFLMIIM